MSYVEGAVKRRTFSKRSRIAAVALIVTAMLGTGLTLGLTSPSVEAAPLADVVDGTVCYSLDEGTGNATEDQQFLHEVTLAAGNPPVATKTNQPLSDPAGNIENIAVRNDTSEIYVYDPAQNQMYTVNADTGAQTIAVDYNLTGLGDIDAMFFQNDVDGDPTNDILWTVLDVNDADPATEDQDILTGYNPDGTVAAGPIAIDFDGPLVTNTTATIEGATWVPDGAGGGEFLISYTATGAGDPATIASLGTAASPAAVPSIIGTTTADVEGLGTDGAGQVFLTTGEDPAGGATINQFWHVDGSTVTSLLDMSAGAPAGGEADFESVDCAFPAITLNKVQTTDPVRLANGNTTVSYTFTITNTGTLLLEDVELTDPMANFTVIDGPNPDDVNGDCSTAVANGTQTLGIGESCTAIWVYEVSDAPGDYVNTATVAGTPPNGLASEVTDTDNTTVTIPAAADPSLAIIKTVVTDSADCPADYAAALAGGFDGLDTIQAAIGDSVVYCINVINNGPGIAENVQVSDSFNSVDPVVIGTLAADAEDSFFYTHTVGAEPETNTATVTGTDQDGDAATSDSDTAGTVEPDAQAPDLQIIKTAVLDPADCPATYADAVAGGFEGLDTVEVVSGANVTYCINVINNGPGVALAVVVSDDLHPAGDQALGDIGVGEEEAYNYFIASADGDQVNVATVNGTDADGNAATPDSDNAGSTPLAPDLQIRKTVVTDAANCPATYADAAEGFDTIDVVSGADVVYCINVINNGPGVAFNVSVSDDLDPNSPQALGTIQPNAEESYNYTITSADGSQTNTATASGEDGNGDPVPTDEDDAGTEPFPPDLQIRKTVVDPSLPCPGSYADAAEGLDTEAIAEGSQVKYCINVINNGPGVAFNVTVTDDLDPNSPRDLGTIQPGAESSYDYSITVGSNPETNVAVVGGEDGDGNPATTDTDNAGTIDPGPSSISNFVFEDTNGNGIQDVGEAGIPGVTVNLWSDNGGVPGAIIGTEVTDANGEYLFDNLQPGTYYVEFVTPAGRDITPLQDAGGDDALDSDADPADGITDPIVLPADTDNTTVDAGMTPIETGSISNFVFEDTNENGIQDGGEPGVPGVTVNLWSDNNGVPGAIIGTVTTDAQGLYIFDNLPPGDYYVEFVEPAGRDLTSQDAGGDDTVDSDPDPADGITDLIVLDPGEDDMTVDAGLLPIVDSSISNLVFEDTNQNGIQDVGEPGIPGVVVNLWSDNGGVPGAIIGTATTDGTGQYLFDGLSEGTYFVEFVAPTGRDFTTQDVGDDALDSDANPADGITGVITLGADEDDVTVDAGLLPILDGSISNFVFEDTNENGVQDAGEPGVPGVVVNLWSDNNGSPGVIIGTDTTDGTGEYFFGDLPEGNYFVEFVAPTGRDFTSQDQGGDDALDSDADPADGITDIIVLGNGENDPTVDAGLLPILNGTISNFVWEDTNENGIQDAGEPGVQGVIVNLWSSNGGSPGVIIANDTTDANGEYLFDNLPAGDYIVQFVVPSGRTLTSQDQGADDGLDSDADTASGLTGVIVLDAGEDDPTIDAGLLPIPGASLSNFVWEDTNQDGIQDAGEPGVPGVTVNLWSSNGGVPGVILESTVTDGAGQYLFDDLSGGDYFVEFVAPTGRDFTSQDSGDDALDSDADPADGITDLITLGNDEDNPTIDAGLLPAAVVGSISNFVFEDTNGDGVQDAGEPAVEGVVVNLWTDNGGVPGVIIATDTTDASGEYLFDGLAAGDYYVQFVAPTGRVFTSQDQGGDDALDSDPDPTSGITGVINLGAGENDPTVDAGLLPVDARLGNFVWVDTNLNGIQDAGEPGIEGATVNVYATDAAGNIPAGSTPITVLTDANGEWTVDVAPGFYRVNVIVPAGATGFTTWNVGDDALDSDIAPAGEPSFGFSGVYTIGAGDENLTVDAGVIFPAELGNFVWLDANNNGIQDAGEAGVEGVTVQVLDSGGGIVTTETTDANGFYLATGLAPGDYTVSFINSVLNGATWTLQDQGGDDALDSDADPITGATATITLGSQESNLTIDAGLVLPASGEISDTVFEDTDGDGVQDPGEPGVSGVTVNLLDGSGTFITSVTTDANGNYSFPGLAPGDYIVEFVLPNGRSFVPADQGGDDATDSDADPTTGRTPVISLGDGETNDTVDAGLVAPPGSSISNLVFEDLDGDGVQDAGENGLEGVTVNLWSDNGGAPGAVIATTTTDASGLYIFDGLDAGTYYVQFVAPDGQSFSPTDQGGDDATDSDAGADGVTAAIVLGTNQDNNTVDAGIVPPPNPVIGLAKRLSSGPTSLGGGQYQMSFTFEIANLGNVDLSQIVLTDDFAAAFPAPANVVSGPTPAATGCSAEVAAAPGHSLAVGESCTAVWTVVIADLEFDTTYLNVASVTGVSPTGVSVSDTADDGANTDTNSNGDPADAGEGDPTPIRINSPAQTGCRNNQGQLIPDQSACPPAVSYTGPFNNAPAGDPVPPTTPIDAQPPLAYTGSSSGVLATLAIALLGAGGALMIGTRRRSDDEV